MTARSGVTTVVLADDHPVVRQGLRSLLEAEGGFEVIGVHRLEARAAIQNGRGNGALAKLGAIQEAVLRKSFLCNGEHVDQVLYSIVADEWRTRRAASRSASYTLIH